MKNSQEENTDSYVDPHLVTTSSAAPGPESQGSTVGLLFLPGALRGEILAMPALQSPPDHRGPFPGTAVWGRAAQSCWGRSLRRAEFFSQDSY